MIRSAYLFSLELVLAALLLFPYVAGQEWQWKIFSLIFVLVLIYALYTYMLVKLGNKAKFLFFVSILPIVFIVCGYAGFNPALILLAGAFIFWRGLALFNSQAEEREMKLLSASMLVSVPAVIFSANKGSEILVSTILLLAIHIVLALAGRFVGNLRTMAGNKDEKGGYIFFYLKSAVALLGIGAALALTLDILKKFFFYALEMMARFFAFLAMPFFEWLETKQFLRQGRKPNLQADAEAAADPSKYGEGSVNLAYTEEVIAVLFTAAIVVGFYYLYRRRLIQFASSSLQAPELVFHAAKTASSGKRSRLSPPANEIRKEFFQLERYAKKVDYGRHPNESLEEWLIRIESPVNKGLISLYENVRYGSKSFNEAELEEVKEGVKLLKEHIRAQKKRKRDK